MHISVVVPVRDRRDLVGRAIDSVRAQTYRDFELIVVDDGSVDGTAQWVQSQFADEVTLLRLPESRGVSAARNHGIAAASGEWIAFLDSDDEWCCDKLERQVDAIAESGLLVCHTDEIWIRNGVRVNPHKHHQKHGGRIFRQSLSLCAMSPSSLLLHRDVFSAIGLFDEGLPACEDYDLFLRLTCRFEVLYLEQKLTIKYGGHEDQLSRAHPAMDRFRVAALDRLLQDKDAPLSEQEREAARQLVVKKAGIVRSGAVKRDNDPLVALMDEFITRWS